MDENKKNLLKEFVEREAPKMQELRYGEGEGEFSVKVYPVLPLSERIKMEKEIFNDVFMGDADNIASFVPCYIDLAKRYATIKYFTDLEIPDTVDEAWFLLNYTPIYDDVAAILGEELGKIFDEVDKRIEAHCNYLENKADFNAIVRKLSDALQKFEDRIPQEDIAKIMDSIKGGVGSILSSDLMKAFIKK